MRRPSRGLRELVAKGFAWADDEFEGEGKVFHGRALGARTYDELVRVLQDAQWDYPSAVHFARTLPKSVPDRYDFLSAVAGTTEDLNWAT